MGVDMAKLFGTKPKGLSIKGVSVSGGDDSESSSDPRLEAVRALFAAIKANDVEAGDLALEDHYKACEGHDSGPEADPESESDDYSSED